MFDFKLNELTNYFFNFWIYFIRFVIINDYFNKKNLK